MRNVEVVSASSTLRGLAYSSIWVYGAVYLHVNLHASLIIAGLVFTAGGIASGTVQIYGGSLSDRFGYKRTLLFSYSLLLILYAASYAVVALISTISIFSLLLVTLMFVNSVQAPAANAIVSLSSDVKLKGFSLLRVGNNIGWGVGPAIGGFLISYTGFRVLFLFAAVMTMTSLILSLVLVEPSKKQESVTRLRTGNKLLILLSVIGLLLFMVQAQETVTLSNYARVIRGLPYYELGFIYLANGLFVVISQPFVFKLSRRIGYFASYAGGTLIYSLGYFSYAFDTGIFPFIASTLFLTIGEDLAFPTGVTMVSNVSKPGNIGRNMGVYNAFLSLGRAAGPLVGGSAFSYTSNPAELWALSTLSGFISFLMFIAIFRNRKEVYETTVAESGELG